jgi:hypothetical protein
MEARASTTQGRTPGTLVWTPIVGDVLDLVGVDLKIDDGSPHLAPVDLVNGVHHSAGSTPCDGFHIRSMAFVQFPHGAGIGWIRHHCVCH